MAVCPNCKKSYGCSCKARKAKDGTACCSYCVAGLNAKIDAKQKKAQSTAEPKVTPPSNVQVIYNGPGKQL